MLVCVTVPVKWSFSAAGEKVSAVRVAGLRTKSQFIPNQALKSGPILGSLSTTVRLWSAFTFP